MIEIQCPKWGLLFEKEGRKEGIVLNIKLKGATLVHIP